MAHYTAGAHLVAPAGTYSHTTTHTHMASAAITKLASNPQVRQIARTVATQAIRQWGNGRQRRAQKGRWYAGKRMGIPPSRRATSAPAALGQQVLASPAGPMRLITGAEMVSAITITHAPINGVWTDSFPINPAEEYTFPRLSSEAQLYQQYSLKGVQFSWVPSVASTQVGTLAIGFQADPTQALPTSIDQMMSLFGAQTGNLWQPMRIPVPAAAMARTLTRFYSNQGKTPAPSDDDRLQTSGRMVVMVEGVAMSAAILGHLRVQYTLEFTDPRPAVKGTTTSQVTVWDEPEAGYLTLANASVHTGIATFFDSGDGQHFTKRTHHPALILLRNGPGGVVNLYTNDVLTTPIMTRVTAEPVNRISLYLIPQGNAQLTLEVASGTPSPVSILTHSCNHDVDYTSFMPNEED